MLDGYVRVDIEGKLIEYNKSYRDMLGYPDEELKNLSYIDITPTKWHDIENDIVNKEILSKGYSGIYQKEYKRKDGTIFPVELRTYLIKDDYDKAVGMWAIVRDITERKEYENKIKESQNFFKSIYNQAAVGIGTLSLDKKWLSANQKMLDLIGYSEDEFIGKSIDDITHEEDIIFSNEAINKAVNGEIDNVFLEKRYINKNGSIIWVNVAANLIFDNHNKPNYFVIVIQDITEKQETLDKLVHSQRNLINLIDGVPYLVTIKDINGKFLLMNKIASKLYGDNPDYIFVINKDDDDEIKITKLRAKETDKIVIDEKKTIKIDEEKIISSDGNEHYLQTIKQPFSFIELDKNAVLSVSIDITELRQVKRALMRSVNQLKIKNEELEKINDKYKITNEELERAYKNLENANKELIISNELAEVGTKAKNEFLMVMSHELRTPLNGILGHLQLLKLDDDINDTHKKTFDMLISSGLHLLSLIQDILDITSIETGKINIKEENFSTKELILNIIDMIQADFDKNNLKIYLNVEDTLIKTDKAKLKQIIINLLSNAKKFTPDGGSIFIDAINRKNNIYLIKIKDNGIGISEDNLDKIFNPFYQIDYSSSRKFGGVGLGLSLVKKFVDRLGGKINVSSSPGEGSIFCFTIKNNINNRSIIDDNIKFNEYSMEDKDIYILAVEDEEISRTVLIEFFKKYKLKYSIVNNGEEAIEYLNKNRDKVDLILMDLQMPIMDGFMTTSILKKDSLLKHIPIIAVTSYAREEDKLRCLEIGFNDYISKPFVINELLDKINYFKKLMSSGII